MSRRSTLAFLAAGAIFALAAPMAASAHDWDGGSLQVYVGQGGYYGGRAYNGYGGYGYDDPYADRRAAWVQHERYEHYQHERAEAQQRYWAQRQWQEGYYGEHHDHDDHHEHDDDE